MPDDVRDTLKLEINGVKKILEYKITEQSPSSSNFDLYEIDNKTLGLKWRFFDPGNILKFQVIYTGDKILSSKWLGTILGVKEIKGYHNKNQINDILFGILFIIFAISLLYFPINYPKIETSPLKDYFKKSLIIILIVAIFVAIFYLFFNKPSFILKFNKSVNTSKE